MGDAGAAAVAARMAGAGLLIPIPNSGPWPPGRPRQASEQLLTPRPAVSPGRRDPLPGRLAAGWLASGFACLPAGWLRAVRRPGDLAGTEPGDLPDRAV